MSKKNKINRDPPLFNLDEASISLMGKPVLKKTNWQVYQNEHWLVTGGNGSGKTTLLKAIAGKLPVCAGGFYTGLKAPISRAIKTVSMDQERLILEKENTDDFSRYFSGSTSEGTRVCDFLFNSNPETDLIHALGFLERLMMRSLRELSTGEMKMVMIAQALISKPEILILDEPFEGLDPEAEKNLSSLLKTIVKSSARPPTLSSDQSAAWQPSVTLIVSTHKFDSIPPIFTNRIHLKDLRVESKGSINGFLKNPSSFKKPFARACPKDSFTVFCDSKTNTMPHQSCRLVQFEDVTVRYGDVIALSHLSWELRQGEKWLVKGANGSGKSTLAGLIYGDNPQAYANKVYLFGKRRGTGESIWEIKKRIGFVSNRLQLGFPGNTSVLATVISGFFDSAGLFRTPSLEQRKQAEQCVEMLEISSWISMNFGDLSTGQQRLVLLARALVKKPELLILDELCYGLDQSNRKKILCKIDSLGMDFQNACKTGDEKELSMIYITHHGNEIPRCMDHMLELSHGNSI